MWIEKVCIMGVHLHFGLVLPKGIVPEVVCSGAAL